MLYKNCDTVLLQKKSCIWETLNLSTDADSITIFSCISSTIKEFVRTPGVPRVLFSGAKGTPLRTLQEPFLTLQEPLLAYGNSPYPAGTFPAPLTLQEPLLHLSTPITMQEHPLTLHVHPHPLYPPSPLLPVYLY